MVGCWFSEAVRFGCLYLDSVVGGFSVGETPGPIPNPEAKPFSADGTALGRVWESRTLPAFNLWEGLVSDSLSLKPTPPFFASFCRRMPRPPCSRRRAMMPDHPDNYSSTRCPIGLVVRLCLGCPQLRTARWLGARSLGKLELTGVRPVGSQLRARWL